MLLVLMLFGVIGFGDVLNVFLIIGGGILFFIALGVLAFNIYVYRLRKKAKQGFGDGTSARTFYWTNRREGGSRSQQPNEGEVKIRMPSGSARKGVNKDVGDYVDFEEEKPDRH